MAITVSASFGGANSQTSGAAITSFVNNGDIIPGEVIVVVVAADNAGTSGTSSISAPTDSKGHTYSLVSTQNRTAGSAVNDGCTVAIYSAMCTTRMVNITDTITANFSPNTTAKVFYYKVFQNMTDAAYSTNGVSGTGSTYNSGAVATASMSTGDIVIGAVASESNTAPTTDTDTTNGSWIGFTNSSAGTGNDNTKMSVSLQYKIVTGSGTQTLNGSATNTDWAVTWALFSPASLISDSDIDVTSSDGESIVEGTPISDSDSGDLLDNATRIARGAQAESGSGTEDATLSATLIPIDDAGSATESESIETQTFLYVTSSDRGGIWDIAPPTVLTESFNTADIEGFVGPDLVWNARGIYTDGVTTTYTANAVRIIDNTLTARPPASAPEPWQSYMWAIAVPFIDGFRDSRTEITIAQAASYGLQTTLIFYARATWDEEETLATPRNSWQLYIGSNAANPTAGAYIRFAWEQGYGVHGYQWIEDDPTLLLADGDRVGFEVCGSATEPTLIFWLNGVAHRTLNLVGDPNVPSSFYAPPDSQTGLQLFNQYGADTRLDDFTTMDLTEVSLETVTVLNMGASHASIERGSISVNM